MAASDIFLWIRHWSGSASEILNEQGLEESIQKSVDAPFIPTENTIRWIEGYHFNWRCSASEILNEQAGEEAEENASSKVLSC